MKISLPSGAAAYFCAAMLASTNASATTIDFESLTDLDPVTNQFASLSFSNATALQAGLSLNDGDFPPHSGSLVISDDGGSINLLFSTPVTQVGAFFTYTVPLTLTAFDALDNVLASAISAFSSNLAASGDAGSSPNEFLGLSFASGIAKLTITGDLGGGSFVLDDLSFSGSAVPEPGTAMLLAAGLAGLLARRRPNRA